MNTASSVRGMLPLVRDATEGDAEACARIYAPYVTDTVVTCETVPPSADAGTDLDGRP